MAAKRQFVCSDCEAFHNKWVGQCVECEGWNTLVEVSSVSGILKSKNASFLNKMSGSINLSEVSVEKLERINTGIGEFNRVLGGGLVPGSVVLLGGDPGIGKTTLLMQSIGLLSERQNLKTIYISGEESPSQIRVRAERLELTGLEFKVMAETSVDLILVELERLKPNVIVIDSIQTMINEHSQTSSGSVSQVKESASRFVKVAKQNNIAIFLVGHVTKEGSIAGPRVLEHMVDVTLYFEGHQDGRYRIVRAIKNRFGAVNEIGVFFMTDGGLREITNPSSILLSRHEEPVSGSVVAVTIEGSRPILVEVQALVDKSPSGTPKRLTVGVEQNRVAMLTAVLSRHGGVSSSGYDVFANIVGGMRVTETGVDLPILLSVLSSLTDKPFPSDTICFGEIGLAGEVRPVNGGVSRLKEAYKQGFRKAIVPRGNAPKSSPDGMEIVAVRRLSEALSLVY
ncbi:MAG: DNA repair protein RadA [Pseudomonadota bacterium]|nr:DNA repair protein RadA [Pseudomonadota bacterium]